LVDRRQLRLRLALPWLAAVLRTDAAGGLSGARTPAAEWLFARGQVDPSPVTDWRAWLLGDIAGGAELLRVCPAGPCARGRATGERPAGTWACVRPVHLLTAIDHLQLAAQRLPVDAAEAAALIGDLNRHFEGRGLRFHASARAADGSDDGDWHLECAEPIACECVEPAAAAGRNLRDLMPVGRDGARVRAWIIEIQMLLHEHPVNTARAARKLPVVNSLWPWGFGSLGPVPTITLPPLYTDDAWLAGLWRLQGFAARPVGEFALEEPGGERGALVGWSSAPDGAVREALAKADADCFEPARAGLGRSGVAEIATLLGDCAVTTDRSARFRFWRRSRPLQESLA
jgi:hypothetical protein